jgi:glutamate synthase (NADPH/NADH) small chain
VTNALTLIADYKRGATTQVSGRFAIVGAGNTAIDAANAALRLGADEVTMVYRRGPEQMSAFDFEYEHAKQEGVRFLWHVQPIALQGNGAIQSLQLERLETTADGSLIPIANSAFDVAVDHVVLAIGQSTHTDLLAGSDARPTKLKLERGRILIDRTTGQTSNPKYFAGGDCTNGGREVVDAVADGKRAGIAMAAWILSPQRTSSLGTPVGGQNA